MALIHRPEPGPRVPSSRHIEPGRPIDAESEIDLRQLARSVFRQRWLIGATLAVVVGAVALFTALQTPEYEAETTLQVDNRSGRTGLLGAIGEMGGIGALIGGESGSIATEIALLQSRSIAESVTDSLRLRVLLVDPEVPRAEILEVLESPRDSSAGVYELLRREDGRYEVRAEGDSPEPQPATPSVGEPIQVAGATIRLRSAPEGEAPERIRIEVLSFANATRRVRNALEVTSVDGGREVLSLRVRHTDRLLAAQIPNAIANSYVEFKTRANTSDAGSSVRFLQEQVERYARDLAAAEERLQQFSERERIVSLPDQVSAKVRQVADLQARRDMLVTEREALRDVLSQTESARPAPGEPSPYRRLATFPTFLSNGIVQNLVGSLTNLETERSRLLGRFTPQHPDVSGIGERISELEAQLHQIGRSYLESLETQVASMDAMLDRFGGELGTAPERQVDYARLLREQVLLEQIYTLLETRLTEAQIREAGEPLGVRVLDAALVPDKPVWPRPLLALILAGLAGLTLGLGVAAVRAALDSKVWSRTDVETAAGGAPVIGAIPRIWLAPVRNGKRRLLGRGGGGKISTEARPDRHLVTFHDPASPAAEAYRGLRTSITLSDLDRAPRIIVATSAMPGEGKSISAANLAITLAQQGTRTLLIDADLRRGSLHKVFGVPPQPGLTEVLLGHNEGDEAIRQVTVGDDGSTLDLLVSGISPPNPAELLGSASMRAFLVEARGRYGMVVLDAPPLRVATDAAVLGALADSTLLIARAGTTNKRALAETAAELERLGISLGGIVVNDVDAGEASYYAYETA